MAYTEYSPEFFECTVPGCNNSVVVTDQKTLHWCNHHPGERPKGYDICDSCEALLPTLSVKCLNKALCDGDHECIGNGRINLMQERGRGTAYWFLMNGQTERPQMYPYCSVCKTGIVYANKCRNVGCRGDGSLLCTGDKKQGLLFMGTQKGETFWPPKQCDACREFIKELTDQPTQCKVCLKYWVFGKDRQRFLVIEKPVSEFRIPERCDGCAALTEDQIKEVKRLALSQARSRQKKRELEQALKTTFGRRSLRKLVRESFVRAASRFFREPGVEQLEKAIMAKAISRLSKSDEPYIGEAFKSALKAVGKEQTKITRLLANPAITDHQTAQVAKALGKLGKDGVLPPGIVGRMTHQKGALGMTTAMAGTQSSKPAIAQAAAYEIHAAAAIVGNAKFPVKFEKHQIATFHYRFRHNKYGSGSKDRSFEGDIVVQQKQGDSFKNTFVDFKHSIHGRPEVTANNLEKVLGGLTHGLIQEAVFVSSGELTIASHGRVADANRRIAQINAEDGGNIPLIKTFVQPW